MNFMFGRCVALSVCVFAVCAGSLQPVGAAPMTQPIVLDLEANDLVYSPLDDRIYASVPNSSSLSPNSLVGINPYTGEIESSTNIGFNPQELVISGDGSMIHAVFGGERGVQPFDVASQTKGEPFYIAGGPAVSQIRAVPGRPMAVLISMRESSSAAGTQVWENGLPLTQNVGVAQGNGGPDIVAVDPTDGTRAYGYQNSNSGYSHWMMEIDENGIHSSGATPLEGVMIYSNVYEIEMLGNLLFNNKGEVYSISPGFQTGEFEGGSNFMLDVERGRLLSVDSEGSTHTLLAYSLDTLQLVDSMSLAGFSGTTESLTRFGGDGIAFRTSEGQVVMLRTAVVPEPSAVALAMGCIAGAWSRRRRRG